MRRLRTLVRNYYNRCSAATPHRYARTRLGIRQDEMMELAARLADLDELRLLENHFLPAENSA